MPHRGKITDYKCKHTELFVISSRSNTFFIAQPAGILLQRLTLFVKTEIVWHSSILNAEFPPLGAQWTINDMYNVPN